MSYLLVVNTVGRLKSILSNPALHNMHIYTYVHVHYTNCKLHYTSHYTTLHCTIHYCTTCTCLHHTTKLHYTTHTTLHDCILAANDLNVFILANIFFLLCSEDDYLYVASFTTDRIHKYSVKNGRSVTQYEVHRS